MLIASKLQQLFYIGEINKNEKIRRFSKGIYGFVRSGKYKKKVFTLELCQNFFVLVKIQPLRILI